MEGIELKFAELQTPLFLAGTNLGLKLDPSKRGEIQLLYMRNIQELHVLYKSEMAIVPITNVVSMSPGKVQVLAPQYTHPIVAGIQSAQVETPYSHVHAGLGAGKKNSK